MSCGLICYLSGFGQNVWTLANSGTESHLKDVAFSDENNVYAVGDNGSVLKSIDFGMNWTPMEFNTNESFVGVQFVNLTTGFIITSNRLYVTTDAGNSWQLQYENSDSACGAFKAVHFINPQIGFIASSGCILKTQDSGLTWTSFSTVSINTMSFPSDYVGYFTGGGSNPKTLYKTTDQGQSFTTTQYLVAGTCNGLCFVDENTGYMIGNYNNFINKSIDGGMTWSFAEDTPYVSGGVDIVFADLQNGYHLKREGGVSSIYHTIDGGANWMLELSFADAYPSGLAKLAIKDGHACAVGYKGVVYVKDVTLGSTQPDTHVSDASISPNPTSGNFRISDNSNEEMECVHIYDHRGKKVKEFLQKCEYFDISDLAPGRNSDRNSHKKVSKKIVRLPTVATFMCLISGVWSSKSTKKGFKNRDYIDLEIYAKLNKNYIGYRGSSGSATKSGLM